MPQYLTYVLFGAIFSVLQFAAAWVTGDCTSDIRKHTKFVKAFDPMFNSTTALPWQSPNENPFSPLDQDLQAGALLEDLRSELQSFAKRALSGSTGSSNPLASSLETFNNTLNDQSHGALTSELVFLDRSVEGWQDLLADLNQQRDQGRNLEVFVLDSNVDGVRQISQTLARFSNLQSVHIVSHGNDGLVQLGSTVLGESNLDGYAAELAGWADGLSEGADLLFYGCNLGASEAGRMFTDSVSALTGADVAASSDLTGSRGLGGDWDLEYQVGKVDTNVVFSSALQDDWDFVLDINIDAAWLAANGGGSGPYYLDQAGETYILQTDVTADGTAFAVIADNITFDLNGHTITYDNGNTVDVFNGSFEQGTGASANGWDFSNAANAGRFAGEFLENEIYDGDYSLRFSSGFTGTQTVTGTSTITLEANTTYSLTGMLQNSEWVSGTSSFVRLVGQNNGNTHEIVWDKKNYRGIQFQDEVFTTGSSSETYKLVIGASNVDGVGADFEAIIDDIRIQRANVYGVALGPSSWETSIFPDVTQFGKSNNARVTNGSIIQANDATFAHGIYVRSTGVEMDNLNITVSGANASAITGKFITDAKIHHNVLNSDVITIKTRDNFDGAVIHKISGEIYENTIVGGPHTGIFNQNNSGLIYNNQISIRSRYTNGFGIMLYADHGSQVYGNTIETSTDDFGGRGIHVQRSDFNDPDKLTVIRDNVIRVREVARNQEYRGVVGGGVYGIQLEGAQDTEVYGNDVTAVGDDSAAYAFRMSLRNDDLKNVTVHDNTFRAIRLNNEVDAASVKLHDMSDVNDLHFENNILISNRGWIGESASISGLVFIGSELRIDGDGTDFIPVQGWNWGSGDAREERAIKGIQFVDNSYENADARAAFYDSPIGNWFGSQAEHASWFFNGYTTTFSVKNQGGFAVANANVKVLDADGVEVFSGTTDDEGGIGTAVNEFRRQGEDRTDYGAYTVVVTSQGEESQVQFNADSKQTIDVQLDVNGPSIDDYTLTYSGTTLYVDATTGANHFDWDASSPLEFSIDGFQFQAFAGTEVIHFRGGAGNDSIQMTGTSGVDQLNMVNGRAVFSSGGVQINTFSLEDAEIDGAGGNDIAYLKGSDGADYFELSDAYVNVSNSEWTLNTTGFDVVTAFESEGVDTAVFVDSSGNDQFISSSSSSVLNVGPKSFRANGFEIVEARAENGGWDSATLLGSKGDDAVTANANMALITNNGNSQQVSGFNKTYINSTGGYDVATAVGSNTRDTIVGDVNLTTFYGTGFSYRFNGFGSISIDGGQGNDGFYLNDSVDDDLFELSDGSFSWSNGSRSLVFNSFFTQVVRSVNGGNDTVDLFDSSGNDRFSSFVNLSTFLTNNSFVRVFDFANVNAYSSGGNDIAIFVGSAGDETVSLTSELVEVGVESVSRRSHGFATNNLYLASGGDDVVTFTGGAGRDTLIGDLYGLRMYGSAYSNYVHGFSSATVDGTNGYDAFYLTDSALNDQAMISTGRSTFSNAHRSIEMHNFETQVLHSTAGGNDTVTFLDSQLNDSAFSNSAYTFMRNSQSFHRANGFENVSINANGGGLDHLEIHGTVSVDEVLLSGTGGSYAGGGLDRGFDGFERVDVYLDLAMDLIEENNVQFEFEVFDEPG